MNWKHPDGEFSISSCSEPILKCIAKIDFKGDLLEEKKVKNNY